MILISIQLRKQLSTPGNATKVFLGDGLKGEKSRRKFLAKKKKKGRKKLLRHENTFNC